MPATDIPASCQCASPLGAGSPIVRAGVWSMRARASQSIRPRSSLMMTDWEVQDFAVQVVRQQLEKQGRQLISWQGTPSVDPSLWFVGDQGPEWVVVRAVRHPRTRANVPANWDKIAAS